jgi:hypothetical protein
LTKLATVFVLLVAGAVALAVAAPALTKLASALTVPIVAGLIACVLRVVWIATRRW